MQPPITLQKTQSVIATRKFLTTYTNFGSLSIVCVQLGVRKLSIIRSRRRRVVAGALLGRLPARYNTTVILLVTSKTPQCISVTTLSPFQTLKSWYSSLEAAASPFSFKWFTCCKRRPFCRKMQRKLRLRFDCIGSKRK